MKLFNIYLLILLLAFTSCDALLEPEDDNHSTFDRVLNDPQFGEGLLMSAYVRIPTKSLTFNDVATDDAVSNDKVNAYMRMATGEWSALYNPVNQWENSNMAILYLNQFLDMVDDVEWKWTDSEANTLFAKRFTGEAYALRGLFKYHLLQTVGGVGENGQLLGIPVYNEFLEKDADFNVPRATFEESVNEIYSDFDKALEYLTMDDYVNITDEGDLPQGYENATLPNYNLVFGNFAKQRISGRIVKSLRARVALLAASPAFSDDDPSKWEQAANLAGQALTLNGGVTIDPNGHIFYQSAQIEAINLASNIDQKEIIWRTARAVSNTRERDNFPPSLFGNGRVNPTQNLVDAFPMANGLPIDHPDSEYDENQPYANRDPRLTLYIGYNGNTIAGQVLKTGRGGGIDAKDSISTSTRTGYYLKKLLNEDVSLNPSSTTTRNHYDVNMRYTELFLIYAEAANEAWGPDGTGTFGFSARNIIANIRQRAGITQPDVYLDAISSKEDMRTLIRNERRLELCFEGFRFWDLRRWKMDLTEPAMGVEINGQNFTEVQVENRAYDNDYMHYGPVPEREIDKFDALIQNQGW